MALLSKMLQFVLQLQATNQNGRNALPIENVINNFVELHFEIILASL